MCTTTMITVITGLQHMSICVYVDTKESVYQAHAPITLSGKNYALNKVYVLNKQVSKCMIMAFFSSKISMVLLVLTGYGVVLACMHLASLDHSMPGYLQQGFSDKTEHGVPG